MEGKGLVIGKKAPDFTLTDHNGGRVNLYESIQISPAMLVFYPGDFTPVCTKQLCNYRDNLDQFTKYGVQIFGISKNPVGEHKKFVEEYDFPFLLLSDYEQKVAKSFGCTSLLMLGAVSRAVFIINTKGVILYRYVEPTVITSRKSDELIGILEDLKKNSLL